MLMKIGLAQCSGLSGLTVSRYKIVYRSSGRVGENFPVVALQDIFDCRSTMREISGIIRKHENVVDLHQFDAIGADDRLANCETFLGEKVSHFFVEHGFSLAVSRGE
jgi:hypothetical protein